MLTPAFSNKPSRKVPDTLFSSRASRIKAARGCSCSDKKFLVKEGSLLFAVRGYSNPSSSNAFPMLRAAQISTLVLVSFLILESVCFSRFLIISLVFSAWSMSSRIPRKVISTRIGSNSVSKFQTSFRSCSTSIDCCFCTNKSKQSRASHSA